MLVERSLQTSAYLLQFKVSPPCSLLSNIFRLQLRRATQSVGAVRILSARTERRLARSRSKPSRRLPVVCRSSPPQWLLLLRRQ